MSDIFISYATADRPRAKQLADALKGQGWSVWWDRNIPPGKQFDEVIEEALDAARCVVVLWTQASTSSTWVKTEAAEAMRRKVLIPALMEEVKIPLEFRRLQAADLSRWTGDPADPQLAHFFESIEAEVKRPASLRGVEPNAIEPAPMVPPVVPPIAPAPRIPAPRTRRLSPALIGGAVVMVVSLLAGGLYYEHSKGVALAEEAARMKAAQEQAERDRQQAARDEADRASRADEERGARHGAPAPAARANTPSQARAVPAAGMMSLQWRDHALGYSGNLSWNPSSALLRVTAVDLRTGMRLGNYAVPALVTQQAAMEYVVSAQFAVPGDSTTPGPHTHTSRLVLRAQQDGSLRLLRNCPQPGECY